MSNDPLFDRIRVKRRAELRERVETRGCDWPDCPGKGTHRAPKGRGNEREYWHFCLEHVRAYNQSYNYFAGMTDEAVIRYQKDALTGHRPTWRLGVNGNAPQGASAAAAPGGDPFGLFSDVSGARRWAAHEASARKPETRTVHNAERKALDVMGLDPSASEDEVKVRFKALVKQHHPDANGGDRSTEDRLREIIKAYKYLRRKSGG